MDYSSSNHEGRFIDHLHGADFVGALVNAGGLTHTSVALRDALLVARPFVEVHRRTRPRGSRSAASTSSTTSPSRASWGRDGGYVVGLDAIVDHFRRGAAQAPTCRAESTIATPARRSMTGV